MIGGPRHGQELGFEGTPPPRVTFAEPPYSENHDAFNSPPPESFDTVRLDYERILEQPLLTGCVMYAFKGRS
jgi:hypothetical protein